LQFSMTLQGLDTSELARNASLRDSFQGAVQEALSESMGLEAESVTITFTAGQVRRLRRLKSEAVEVGISVITGDVAPAQVAAQLDPKLLSSMTKKMQDMPNIKQLISGDLAISEITAPTVPTEVVESLRIEFEELTSSSCGLPSCQCFCGVVVALLMSALAKSS